MARQDIEFSDLIDVAGLTAECRSAVEGKHRPSLELRAALLPIVRRASVDGREKAHQLLLKDGSGLNCAR